MAKTQKSRLQGLSAPDGTVVEAKSDASGNQRMVVENALDAFRDAIKTVSSGRQYYDLRPIAFEVPANTQVTVGNGENYDVSATGAWILHPLIKYAKKIQLYVKVSQATQFKLYSAPVDNPDQNTPEYVYRGDGESEWMFLDKSDTPFAIWYPASSRIREISANALKFYVRNEGASAETVEMRIRLIF